MSNSYYNFSPRFIPGTKVRAQAVNTQFDLLEDAFDLLPTTPASIPLGKSTLGVESGSGNAYVLTMPNTRLANADGDEVVFKATHQNSGATTLQVDAVSAASWVRWDGTAMSSGDVIVGAYYAARYDATNMRFVTTYPAQSTIAGTISYATPTGKAKLAASAGAASTVIRSDADIAIDVTIAPTWTGQHTFSNPTLGPAGTAFLPAWSFSGDTNTGAYSVGADDWGVATGGVLRFDISTTAVTSTLPLLANAGSNTAPSHSFSGDSNTGAYSAGADDWGVATGGVLRFDISTTAVTSTLPLLVNSGSNTAPSHSFSGDTNTGMYSSTADVLSFTTGGVQAAFFDSTGVLNVNKGIDFQTASTMQINARGGAFDFEIVGRNAATNISFYSGNGVLAHRYSATTQAGLGVAGTVSNPAYSFIGDTDTGLYNVAANTLAVTAGGVFAVEFQNNGGACQTYFTDGTLALPSISFASDADTGITTASIANTLAVTCGGVFAGLFQNNSGVTSFFASDGSVSFPGIAFNSDADTGFYHTTANQIAISLGGTTAGQIAQGTFTATATGMSSTVTGTASYQRFGNLVMLKLPLLQGTSNTTDFTVTGVPAVIQSALTNQNLPVTGCVDQNVAVATTTTSQSAQLSGGTITFLRGGSSIGWTNSGIKGYNGGTICYLMA